MRWQIRDAERRRCGCGEVEVARHRWRSVGYFRLSAKQPEQLHALANLQPTTISRFGYLV